MESAPAAAENLVSKVPLPEAPMDRASLLAAIAEAASAATLRQDDTVAQRALDGKLFELRIRFGCSGPAANLKEADFGWTYDADQRVLRVRAMPTLVTGDAALKSLISPDIEAAEGFWLSRPWVLQAECPATPVQRQQQADEAAAASAKDAASAPVDKSAPPPSFPRIGIAQFFTATDSRTGRRDGRPYQATKTLDEGATGIGDRGFELVLSGRLRAVPGGGVIRCAAPNPDTPPDCIVGARFDRVWIELPQTRELIAEWGSS